MSEKNSPYGQNKKSNSPWGGDKKREDSSRDKSKGSGKAWQEKSPYGKSTGKKHPPSVRTNPWTKADVARPSEPRQEREPVREREDNITPKDNAAPESPAHDELRGHLMAMYQRCISNRRPLDSTTSYYFRNHGKVALKARGFLASAVYGMLRNRLRLMVYLKNLESLSGEIKLWHGQTFSGNLLDADQEAVAAMILFLKDQHKSSRDEVVELIRKARPAWSVIVREGNDLAEIEEHKLNSPPEMEWIVRHCDELLTSINTTLPDNSWQKQVGLSGLPTDIFERWRDRFGDESAQALGKQMQQPAPLDLRVNRIKAKRDSVLELLEKEGIESEKSDLSPDGLRVTKKGNIFHLAAFHDGLIEVQDVASQMIGFACNPKPTWRVLDACAGGGGKTLHLASLMENRGELFAHDQSEDRLAGLKKRLKRSGASNVRFLSPGTCGDQDLFDLVLIDAPCLGLGTLRRNPDLLWRGLLKERIQEITRDQEACLNEYAPLVKPGGILVYATCSFEPEETDLLLKNNPLISDDFEPDPLLPNFQYHHAKITLPDKDDHCLVMAPHITQTDGFFVARYRRKM